MPNLAQMKLLINLAKIDGKVAKLEQQYILNIARAHGIDVEEVNMLLDQHLDVLVPENLSVDQKFEYIFSLIQLMKIDERLYKQELIFCSNIALALGYDQQVMFDLMLYVQSGSMDEAKKNKLKTVIQKHLKA